jgi:hypothetical protein
MNLPAQFSPPRKLGLIFHISVTLFLSGAISLCLYFAARFEGGLPLIFSLLFALLLLGPLLIIIYRGYALIRGRYILEREGLRLRWGLREEDIPLADIEWIRPAGETGFQLPLPRFNWPGAILGTRLVEGLGEVEYLASDHNLMLMVATSEHIYVISPANIKGFLSTYQGITELGSLSSLVPYSSLPTLFMRDLWSDRLARNLMISGFVLTLILYIIVSGLIPTLEQVSLGFDAGGSPLSPGQPERLFLLPVVCTFTFIFDILAGMLFYWWSEKSPPAYLFWASSILTPVLLLIALIFMI